MMDERYDGLAQNVGRGDEASTEEQCGEHSELDLGQVAVADDVGQDAVAVVDAKPLDMVARCTVRIHASTFVPAR